MQGAEKKLYFINPWADFLLIGGASLLVYVGMTYIQGGERTLFLATFAMQLQWICNWPHFASTNYRLYSSRDNIRQYPVTALVVPVLIAGAALLALQSPAALAPYFVKLFLLWSPYHFSGQTVGVSLIYARRAGFQVKNWQRQALILFIYGTYVMPTIRAEVVGSNPGDYYGLKTPVLGVPAWSVTVVQWGIIALAATLAASFLWQTLRSKQRPPLIFLLPAVTQYIWFVRGNPVASFQLFVPFFHSLQYLVIAWIMQLKVKMDQQQLAPSKSYVWQESLRWFGINIMGGAFLFFFLPRLCMNAFHLGLEFATGVVIAGVQIHHFFVDGVIWKLKNKNVASPLMTDLAELLNPPPALTQLLQKRPPERKAA